MSDPIMDAYKDLYKSLEIANVKIRNDARNDAIEECAKLCDDALGDYARADELADLIRALKKKK